MTCRHRTFLDRIKPQAVASPFSISSQVVPSTSPEFENCCWRAARFCLPRPPLFSKTLLPFTGGCPLPPSSAHRCLGTVSLPCPSSSPSHFLSPPQTSIPRHVLGSLFSASPLFPPICTRLRCSLRFLRSCREYLGASHRLRLEISPSTGVSSLFQTTWRALRRMSLKG